MENSEISVKKIEEMISSIKNQFPLIRKKFKDPEDLDIKNYVWVVFSGNIIYKTEDLLIILKEHENKGIKIKAPLYILIRSILEDVFYMRYILVNKKEEGLKKRFDAYGHWDYKSKKTHLNAIKSLESRGKFIYEVEGARVLSKEGIENRITELSKEISNIESLYKGDKEFEDMCNSFGKVEEICKRYDEVKGINKIEPKKETLSLEWVYNYLYRFKSMYIHPSISTKEDVIECIWDRTSYKDNNGEILSLLVCILDTIKDTKKEILN